MRPTSTCSVTVVDPLAGSRRVEYLPCPTESYTYARDSQALWLKRGMTCVLVVSVPALAADHIAIAVALASADSRDLSDAFASEAFRSRSLWKGDLLS